MVQDLLKIKKNEYYTMKNIVIAAEYANSFGGVDKELSKAFVEDW